MSQCSFATVELKTYQVVSGSVGDSNADIVVGTGTRRVQICTTHQFVQPVSKTDVGHRGLTEDEVVLNCNVPDATKYHRVSF